MSNENQAVRLERTFQADIDRVFRAFTDPTELVHWWGPMDVRTSAAEIDLRMGGECLCQTACYATSTNSSSTSGPATPMSAP